MRVKSAKEISSGDTFRCALRTIAFEGWELCFVGFWSMRSLFLHRLDTAINSYRVCRVERQIAIVSSISKIENEDRGVGSSPLGSRSTMSSPSLHYQENHYSNGAVEEANENRVKHGNWNTRKKRNLNANGRQEAKLGSQKPPKDGKGSQTHGLSNALLHSSVEKSWNRPHLASKSDPKTIFVKFDH